MPTLKNQVQEIHEDALAFAERAEQYAEQFQDLVATANALTVATRDALIEESLLTQELLRDFAVRMEHLHSNLASAIRQAGLLNYAGAVRQAEATEQLGHNLIAAAVVSGWRQTDPEVIIGMNMDILLSNVADAEKNHEEVTFEQMVSRSGGAPNLTAIGLQRIIADGLVVEKKLDDGRFVLAVNTANEEFTRRFPFLAQSTDFLGDLARRLRLLYAGVAR